MIKTWTSLEELCSMYEKKGALGNLVVRGLGERDSCPLLKRKSWAQNGLPYAKPCHQTRASYLT